jgi:hypothetical protein
MVTTRSQRPQSGSPTPAAPATSKKAQKSKAKTEKKITAATGKKPAKVQKGKSSKKRKGPKSASKDSPEAPSQATSRPPSKTASEASLKAIAEAALEQFSNSEALFNPHDLTPELLEELGLAYVDLPSFNAPAQAASDATQAKSRPQQTFMKTGPREKNGKPVPKGFYSHPHLFPEHWDVGPPFGAHDKYQRSTPPPARPSTAAPAEFPRGGRLY